MMERLWGEADPWMFPPLHPNLAFESERRPFCFAFARTVFQNNANIVVALVEKSKSLATES